ncbi:hypothetical protein GOB94_15905 [Granulicella sp. 5B5]|uniref:hypothetical protein n=1 Tax=Granulicella sp. 5B5 TaxID=1617967 RepID=UPI0015F5ECF6|nr:hypothetical protein [Granulicella sp. 5B5]QMV19998.1 hypothetical protein GOB94_15905 [Granulicella sp. 5B5]
MNLILKQFLQSYLSFLIRAAWSLQQNLVGAGHWSTSFLQFAPDGGVVGGGWAPAASLMPLLGLLFVLVLISFPFLVLTGYVLGRKKGAVITITILLLPGLLGLAGLWPTISPTPAAFEVGGVGILGDVAGTISLIALAVVAGWSVTILLVDCLRIRRRFWDIFDHLWLVFSLVTVIFFVSDANVAQHDRDYAEAERDTQRASAYLLKQVDAYGQWCHNNSRSDLLSCYWTSGVHQTLLNASFEEANLFGTVEPKSSAQLYGWYGRPATPQQILTIRKELAAYNQMMCPVIKMTNPNWQQTLPTRHCEMTPAVFLRAWPEPLQGKVDKDLCGSAVALDSECMIPTLAYLHQRDSALANRSESEHRSKNYRWMYYLFFSCVLGAKLAGSTVRLTALDERPDHETRRGIRVLCHIVTTGFRMIRSLLHHLARFLKWIKAKWRWKHRA